MTPDKAVVNTWFEVEFLRYGYAYRGTFYPARWTRWSVQTASAKDALQLARQRFRRAEQFRVVK